MTEQEIEQALIEKLVDLKYSYRQDIRDRAASEEERFFKDEFERSRKKKENIIHEEFEEPRDRKPSLTADADQKYKELLYKYNRENFGA